MAKTDPKPAVGQRWRRRSDGMWVDIVSVSEPHIYNPSLTYMGYRRSTKLVSAFMREFDFRAPAPSNSLPNGDPQ